MASQPIAAWTEHRIPAPVMRLVPTEAPAKFSDLEWSIVAMAQSDSLATLREPSRFWSMVNAIFGVKPANRLANDRLEALRRVAVLAWRYRWNVPTSELKAFFSAGFSEAQYEQLQSRISAVRASSARRTAR